MTAKEKLREAVERLTEADAEESLRFLDERSREPLLDAVRHAALDDEPSSLEEIRAPETRGRSTSAARPCSCARFATNSSEPRALGRRGHPSSAARPA